MNSNNNDKSNSLETPVPKSIHEFIDSLPEKYMSGNIDKKLEEDVDIEWKKFNSSLHNTKKKKFILSSVSVASIFIIFITLGFVSPTMANVMTKIPLINILFETESPLNEEIITALENKNYNWDEVNISPTEKLVSITLLDAEENSKSEMEEIKQITKDILINRGYNAYSVEVSIDSLDEDVDSSKSIDGKIRLIDEDVINNDPEVKWATTLIPTMSTALTSSHELKVIGISHSYKENKVYVEIHTSLLSINTGESYEVIEAIKKSVNDYLKSEKNSKLLKDDKYKVTILNKDKSEQLSIIERK